MITQNYKKRERFVCFMEGIDFFKVKMFILFKFIRFFFCLNFTPFIYTKSHTKNFKIQQA